MAVSAAIKKANTLQNLILRTNHEVIAWDQNSVTLTELKVTKSDIEEHRRKLVAVFEELNGACTADEMMVHNPTFDTLFQTAKNLQITVGELLANRESLLKSQTSPSFKLERIKLPLFQGVISEWESFHDLFKSSVDKNPTLSGAEKLIHLKSCLSGEAASIVNSFQATDANYKVAWGLVVKRYSNKREIVFAHIKKLDDVKTNGEESASGIRLITDTINECVRSLKGLGVPVDKWDLIIIFLTLKKLSKETKKQWLLDDKTVLPTLDKFIEYLEVRARALANSETTTKSKGSSSSSNQGNLKKSSHAASSGPTCPKCSESHHLFKCKSFVESPPTVPKELVIRKQLCYNCLFPGHSVSKCRMEFSCRKCGRRHHSLLHIDPVTQSSSSSTTVENEPSNSLADQESIAVSHSTLQQQNQKLVLMGTIIASVEDSLGNKQHCRIFLDPGSESNFITEYCVDRLGLKRKKTCVTITGISGSAGETSTGIVRLNLFSNVINFKMTISSLILKKITNKMPRAECSGQWPHLQGLALSDPTFSTPGHIDILIGAEDAALIMLQGMRHGPRGTPSAQNTKFGWMISGGATVSSHHVQVRVCHASCSITDTCLNSKLTKFWELEDLGSPQVSTSEEDNQCQQHFKETHYRNPKGEYVVELPFKKEAQILGQSRHLSLKRFYRVENRLSQNQAIKDDYIKCMRESIDSGFLELIPSEEVTKPEDQIYYMPHREVIKESSSSTKVRIVYDASAKASNGISLNDVLMTGPKLQSDLVPLLIRFRSHLIAMSADIVKFYPQYHVNRKHVDFQRLLWREDVNSPIQDYRMLRVTFGVTSAPFLAIRCLQQLADDERVEFPVAAEVIKEDFLVDNLLSGCDDMESALALQNEILEIMKRGNLNLSKWSSNNFEIVQAVPPDQREIQFPLSISEDESIKTIGLLWNPTSDSFGVSINIPNPSTTLSKRKILSAIAKTFDPLGWLSPITVRAKILMQSLWKIKLDWDSPLPAEICKQWTVYSQDLSILHSFRINRCIVGPRNSSSEYELHGFSDASKNAYAACIYLRTIGGQEDYTNLVIAKTKVAPVKMETIPRLELCGAVLLSTLIKTVRESLHLEFRVIRCWTDSTIVLDWISSKGKLPIFVSNRVRKIQNNCGIDNWHHVSGNQNPADPASRGISAQVFLSSQSWLNGPPMLINSQFPQTEVSEVHAHNAEVEESRLYLLIQKISSYVKLKRIVAFCHRFIQNCRVEAARRQVGSLRVEDLNKSFVSIILCVQAESFNEEIQKCKKRLLVKSRIKFLTPFLDDWGILRVGGRLSNSKLSQDQKHPILLPKNHQFTQTLVQYFHLLHHHAGVQLLLCTIRDQFWIIRGKDVASRIVRRCVTCHRLKTKTSSQIMGQLPFSRANPSKPFSKTGVDYAGPFMLCLIPGRKPKLVKFYVSVFVCMATKAIHLELAGDLSTASFIGALTRFLSRRGLPTDIFCDNGKNFVGAKNEMAEFAKLTSSNQHQNTMNNFLIERNIKYHFNPPMSPHHGGLWEAGVKSMKFHLKRVIQDRHLSIEEFTTLLCQVEACLNSRPLTQLSTDPNDFSVLTPGHFLMGEAPLTLPQHDLTEVKINRLSRWQVIQQMFQHFWRRWTSEYLQTLQSRPKWFNPQPNLEVGVLVLIRDDEPIWGHLKWKLGRIIKVYPGPDGNVRVCDVQTGNKSVCQRPVVKLSPLPISD